MHSCGRREQCARNAGALHKFSAAYGPDPRFSPPPRKRKTRSGYPRLSSSPLPKRYIFTPFHAPLTRWEVDIRVWDLKSKPLHSRWQLRNGSHCHLRENLSIIKIKSVKLWLMLYCGLHCLWSCLLSFPHVCWTFYVATAFLHCWRIAEQLSSPAGGWPLTFLHKVKRSTQHTNPRNGTGRNGQSPGFFLLGM